MSDKVPKDLYAEAMAIGTPREQELAKKVAQMDAPTRAAASVALAVEGAGYSEIARVMDYATASEAKRAVWNALGQIEQDAASVAERRELMAAGLTKLLRSCMRRGTNPNDPDHLAYVRVVLAIYDRQAKLYGLDAPTTSIVYSPSAAEVNEYVNRVRNLVVVEAGDIEADVLEAG